MLDRDGLTARIGALGRRLRSGRPPGAQATLVRALDDFELELAQFEHQLRAWRRALAERAASPDGDPGGRHDAKSRPLADPGRTEDESTGRGAPRLSATNPSNEGRR